MARRGFVVLGRVQGVGFRWWTRKTAQGLGLSGRAWNRPDGAVEVHVEGEAEAVDEMERLLARGPVAARVREVTRVPADPGIEAGAFRIVR